MNIMKKLLSQGSTAGSPTTEDGAAGGEADASGDAAAGGGQERVRTPRTSTSSVSSVTSGRSQAAGSSQQQPRRDPQDLLGLSHLRKLMAEYRCPPHPLTEADKEVRLRAMLPLFCKVFAPCSAGTAKERLPELTPLAQATSRLLVAEVRKRAGNQSTEEAAAAIAEFMEVGNEGEEKDMEKGGWMVLSSINIMCGEGEALLEVCDLLHTY